MIFFYNILYYIILYYTKDLFIKIPHYTSSLYWFYENKQINESTDLIKIKQEFLQEEFQHIKNLDKLSDINIYEFVLNNYKDKQLFHGRFYPTYFIFHYLSTKILEKINIDSNFPAIYKKYVFKKKRIKNISVENKKMLELTF